MSLLDDPATGQVVIGFTLNAEASRRFSDYTSTHIGEPMAIVLDKRVLSSPTIVAPIAGEGIIAGVPTEDVRLLATQLQIGVLGVPLVLVEQRIVPTGTSLATPGVSQLVPWSASSLGGQNGAWSCQTHSKNSQGD